MKDIAEQVINLKLNLRLRASGTIKLFLKFDDEHLDFYKTKERLFKIALKISDLEQFKNEENQELLTNLKKYFELLAADLDQLEGPSFFDEYLLFTANRDAYQLYECLQIEKRVKHSPRG